MGKVERQYTLCLFYFPHSATLYCVQQCILSFTLITSLLLYACIGVRGGNIVSCLSSPQLLVQIGSQIHLTFDSKLSCIDLLLSWSRLESYPKKKSFMVYPEFVEDIAVVWVRIRRAIVSSTVVTIKLVPNRRGLHRTTTFTSQIKLESVHTRS